MHRDMGTHCGGKRVGRVSNISLVLCVKWGGEGRGGEGREMGRGGEGDGEGREMGRGGRGGEGDGEGRASEQLTECQQCVLTWQIGSNFQ